MEFAVYNKIKVYEKLVARGIYNKWTKKVYLQTGITSPEVVQMLSKELAQQIGNNIRCGRIGNFLWERTELNKR